MLRRYFKKVKPNVYFKIQVEYYSKKRKEIITDTVSGEIDAICENDKLVFVEMKVVGDAKICVIRGFISLCKSLLYGVKNNKIPDELWLIAKSDEKKLKQFAEEYKEKISEKVKEILTTKGIKKEIKVKILDNNLKEIWELKII